MAEEGCHMNVGRAVRTDALSWLPRQGDTLEDRYLLIDLLGEGGMGQVWRAVDRRLERPVAIKMMAEVLHSRLGDAAAVLFCREAMLAGRVHSPHVLSPTNYFTHHGTPCIVTEYIAGVTLRDLIQRHTRLSVEQAVRIALQIASALAACHAQGITHGDVKPLNILVDNELAVYLCDFGLATSALQSTDSVASGVQATNVAGSPSFMAPEALFQGGVVGPKADIHALGIILFMMLAGEHPYRIDRCIHPHDVMLAIRNESPKLLENHRTDVPEPLAELLRLCLSKKPAERPDAREAVRVLTGYLFPKDAASLKVVSTTAAAIPPSAEETTMVSPGQTLVSVGTAPVWYQRWGVVAALLCLVFAAVALVQLLK